MAWVMTDLILIKLGFFLGWQGVCEMCLTEPDSPENIDWIKSYFCRTSNLVNKAISSALGQAIHLTSSAPQRVIKLSYPSFRAGIAQTLSYPLRKYTLPLDCLPRQRHNYYLPETRRVEWNGVYTRGLNGIQMDWVLEEYKCITLLEIQDYNIISLDWRVRCVR